MNKEACHEKCLALELREHRLSICRMFTHPGIHQLSALITGYSKFSMCSKFPKVRKISDKLLSAPGLTELGNKVPAAVPFRRPCQVLNRWLNFPNSSPWPPSSEGCHPLGSFLPV